jgi:cell division transport system permease protein
MNLGLMLSEVGQGFRRNASMVVSVVLVTFISLTFVGAAILLQMQIGQMKGYWYDRAQVAVYLCNGLVASPTCSGAVTDDQLSAVRTQLEGDTLAPLVQQVEFEDQQQAFERTREQFGDSSIGAWLTPEYSNSTFWVNMVDPEQSDVITEALAGYAGVDEVVDMRAFLDPIFSALNAGSYTAIGIAVLMLVAAVLLIATTIRMSAFSRRREIGIMRLVGASNRFIRTPFVIEGIAASLIGAVLAAVAIVLLVQFFVGGYLAERFENIALVDLDDALLVVPIVIVTGALLAGLSANVAIRRYLRV